MKHFVFRFLCIALLLAGQQAALTHALAHAEHRLARSTVEQDGGAAGKAQGERYALCDFDYAYSQVLGAIHSACIPALRLDATFHTLSLRGSSRAAATVVPFLIRGPPQLL